jgi:head-tail adaptor
MKRGRLRHVLTLQRVTRSPNEYGTEAEAWADLATLRAEVTAESAAEAGAETAGTRGRKALTFITRFIPGVTVGDRVLFGGQVFDLREVREIQPGKGLELICEGAA